jgi:hypothetical protein
MRNHVPGIGYGTGVPAGTLTSYRDAGYFKLYVSLYESDLQTVHRRDGRYLGGVPNGVDLGQHSQWDALMNVVSAKSLD